MVIVENLSKVVEAEEKSYTYIYRLLKSEVSLTSEGDNLKVQAYGIEIERQDYLNGVIVNCERESVCAISPQRYRVHNLLKLLYDNCVSPIHLIDIAGEYIDEYVSDFDYDLNAAATN